MDGKLLLVKIGGIMKKILSICLVLSFMVLVFCGSYALSKSTNITEKEAQKIAREAYIYFYPLVTMDITRRQMTNREHDEQQGRGLMNTFTHARTFPDADFKGVVCPNFDTLYSSGWVDLTKEPIIISVPDTSDRYYLLPMMDMWTDVFADPGKRTTGTKAGNFALTLPCWKGNLPKGVERINSPTPYVWILGRTQTNGPKDYEAVHKVQDGYKMTPLSQWGKKTKPPKAEIDPKIDMKTPPLKQVISMSAPEYFQYALEIMKVTPPHLTDQAILSRIKRIGLEPGKSFDFEKADPIVKKALEKAQKEGLKFMNEKSESIARLVNGWKMSTDTIGVYGNSYLKRAIVAMKGLAANPPEDSIYPSSNVSGEGNPYDGKNKYLLHFDKTEMPPVNAFWSVTLYDKDGFPVANSINRFAVGDRDVLKFNTDGSLDIYIQNDKPSPDKESNWLPAPKGTFNLLMRLYYPQESVLNNSWAPPAVTRNTSNNQ